MSTELSEEDRAILEALLVNDGEANTSELKEHTGYENNRLWYRRDYHLEENGLVECEVVEHPDDPNLDVTVWHLTDEGEEVITDVLDSEESPPPLSEQVEELGDRVEEVAREVRELNERIEAFDARVDDVEEEVIEQQSVREEIDGLENKLRDEIEVVENQVDRISSGHSSLSDRVDRLEMWQQDVVDAFYYNGVLDAQTAENGEHYKPGHDTDANLDQSLVRPGPVLEWLTEQRDESEGTDTRSQRL